MADESVKYEMSLNDLVSGKLDSAEKHAQKFEGRLGSVHSALGKLGEKVLQVGEYLGISFAFVKFEEFFREGTELVHKFDIAEGQLQNTLKNVGERAGLTSEQLVAMAQKVQHEIPLTTDKIVDMENALSRFGNMTPSVYQKVLAMSADIATALKRDGTEVATTLGRIMEAPAENGRLLRQLYVTLTAEDRKYLMQLERTGQIAKAQTFIFQELATKGYAGAAAAAAKSDPLFRYNKAIYELEMQVGKAGIALEETFAPGLEKVSSVISTAVHYAQVFGSYLRDNLDPILKEIKYDATALAAGIAVAATGWAIANPIVISYTAGLIVNSIATAGLTVATYAMTAAQWLLNVAMTANPVGLIVVAIGALVTGLILAYKHSETFRAALAGVGSIALSIWHIFEGLGEVIVGVFTLNPTKIKQGLMDSARAMSTIGSDFVKTVQKSFQDDENTKHETTLGKTVKKSNDPKKPVGVSVPKSPGPVSKVTGSKVLNINIHIGALIKEMKIQTSTFKDGVGRAQSMVTEALLMAVNDSQLAAGD